MDNQNNLDRKSNGAERNKNNVAKRKKSKMNTVLSEKKITNLGRESINKELNKNIVTKNLGNNPEKVAVKERRHQSINEPKSNAPAPSSKENEADNVDFKNSPALGKSTQPKSTKKKSINKNTTDALENTGLGTFEMEDIVNNPRVIELIQDLVNCFTSNSTLPENELQNLKMSFFERTCSVFLDVLNGCVQKAFTKLLNSDFVQELQKKPVEKKNACCQTSYSQTFEDKGRQLQ